MLFNASLPAFEKTISPILRDEILKGKPFPKVERGILLLENKGGPDARHPAALAETVISLKDSLPEVRARLEILREHQAKKIPAPECTSTKRIEYTGCPSRSSAVRKSRQSSEERPLTITTPANIALLSQSGIIVPDNLDPSVEEISLDFTRLSDRVVGAVHSRFAVRHAHALYVRAGNATDALRLKRRHRLLLAAFRVHHAKEYRTDRACAEAFSLTRRAGGSSG
jgi:hypothetical protein